MIRVLRVLEYEYDSVEAFAADVKRWGVGAVSSEKHGNVTIRSGIVGLPDVFAFTEPVATGQ